VLRFLALIAAAVSTAALLVVVSLTAFVASLAFRAKKPHGSGSRTRDLEMSMVGEPRANRPRTQRGPSPGADADRLA
jgi:hypothetical protein